MNFAPAMDDLTYKEHKLAKKAKTLLEYQQEFKRLEKKKIQIEEEKPLVPEQQLTYKESIKFGKKIKEYRNRIHKLEQQLLKSKRQLSALELQIKKLLPVSGVKVKVSIAPGKNEPSPTFCIKHCSEEQSNVKRQVHVERL